MLYTSLVLVAVAYGALLVWAVARMYKKQHHAVQYYLALGVLFCSLCIQSITSLHYIHQVITEHYLGLVVGMYLVLWALSCLLSLFCLFVIAYALFSVALLFALSAIATLLLFSHETHHIALLTSQAHNINWHIIGAVLSLIFLTATALCAFFVRRLEHSLKRAYLLESDMIVTLPLDSMQAILRVLSWISWSVLTVTLASGYLFTESLLEQKLWHKLVFTAVAWCALSAFLLMNHMQWLSHAKSNRFLYMSTLAVFIGYFGTRLAVDYIV